MAAGPRGGAAGRGGGDGVAAGPRREPRAGPAAPKSRLRHQGGARAGAVHLRAPGLRGRGDGHARGALLHPAAPEGGGAAHLDGRVVPRLQQDQGAPLFPGGETRPQGGGVEDRGVPRHGAQRPRLRRRQWHRAAADPEVVLPRPGLGAPHREDRAAGRQALRRAPRGVPQAGRGPAAEGHPVHRDEHLLRRPLLLHAEPREPQLRAQRHLHRHDGGVAVQGPAADQGRRGALPLVPGRRAPAAHGGAAAAPLAV
mmetsp:Transcript_120066/g.340390  ORF Transcript_120066/g.340390 Transcript_120066/m.340390 type:complete len:255 (-) Transcript_120066:613-1377(-)